MGVHAKREFNCPVDATISLIGGTLGNGDRSFANKKLPAGSSRKGKLAEE